MGQDIREMLRKEDPSPSQKLSAGHQERFGKKLDDAFPKKKKNDFGFWIKIAAIFIVVLGTGLFLLNNKNDLSEDKIVETNTSENEDIPVKKEQFQLSEVSPEFRKIENYYLASLNIELAKLEITEENKELIDSFMEQMKILEKEYVRLNKEFAEIGANEQTLEAMIKNLQLRLELLYKLKNKIKEIKQSERENYETNNA